MNANSESVQRQTTQGAMLTLLGFALFAPGTNAADRTEGAAPHAGHLLSAVAVQCELVFRPDSIRVYLFDREMKPFAARDVVGSISMKDHRSPKQIRYDLFPESTRTADANCLVAPANLYSFVDATVQCSMVLRGAPQQAGLVHAKTTIRLTPSTTSWLLGRQRICPVSRNALSVANATGRCRVNNMVVLLCCQECAATFEQDPKRYLARLVNETQLPRD